MLFGSEKITGMNVAPGSFLGGINPLYTDMKGRLRITISPFRLHAASSVWIPNSTHSFRTLLPTIRMRPQNLLSA